MANQDELHWATLWEDVTDAVGDDVAIVEGATRRTWSEFEDRAARLASAFAATGLGRGAKVAQYLFNSAAYAESWFATLKVRGVPVNVNYRYLADELLYLLANSDAEALVFHSSLGEHVAAIRDRAANIRLFVEVDDGASGQVPGAMRYEDLLADNRAAPRIARSERDQVMTYTGGTTGLPKGVVGRIGPGVRGLLAAVPPLVGEPPVTNLAEAAETAARLAAEGRRLIGLAACPLMHGTGMVIGMQTPLLLGGAMVLLENRRFDPHEVWDLVEAEGVQVIAIVGDPFARPLLRALDEDAAAGRGRQLGTVRFISSSGAMFSTEVKTGLLEHLPQGTILDYISSTEGLMGASISRRGAVAVTGRFHPVPGVGVLDEGGSAVRPGSGEIGLVALSGGVPDAYYKDDAKSAATFREVDGIRLSFPGDWATVEADGSITLLGRGSQCINTGGEKVFPEEVEEVVKRHDAIEDCLVFGVHDDRFGQRVVAVASRRRGHSTSESDVLAQAKVSLAGYKVPRTIRFVTEVPRTSSGKADYPAARQLFEANQ